MRREVKREMSEFTCYNGHDMAPSDGPKCKKCGEGVWRMDGFTNAEWKRMERAEDEDGREEGGE